MGKKKEGIIMAVINEIERDLNNQCYESLDEMLMMLLEKKSNKKILLGYLSDDIAEQLHDGKLDMKY